MQIKKNITIVILPFLIFVLTGCADKLAKKSKLLPEIFHSDVLEHYIHAAEWEQKDYDLSVNDWQLRRYFERG